MEEVLRSVQARLRASSSDGSNMVEDPFEVLGVAPTAPLELIYAVYRTKARFYHPDNVDTGDAAAFKRLQAAYEAVLQAIK